MARAPITQTVDAIPEADRLDGFPHPRMTRVVVGHTDARSSIEQAFGSQRMHHAWLISGPEGIGKATFAYAIARYALALPAERGAGLTVPEGSIADRQVTALSHPGLLVIRRPWDQKNKRHMSSITVDEVRRSKSFLTHSAAADSWRVIIVDQADELNVNAANALLKSLEEPPARALFLLISSEPGRLLTTIRSRCRRLALEPLNPTDLRKAAEAAIAGAEEPPKPPAEGDWGRLSVAAHGSVRRLLSLSASDGAKLSDKTQGLVQLLPKVDWPQVHSLADEMVGPGTEQKFEQFFTLLTELVGRLIRARAVGAAASGADGALAERVIPAHSLATWAELWENMHHMKSETMSLNLDRKSLILDLVVRMQVASKG